MSYGTDNFIAVFEALVARGLRPFPEGVPLITLGQNHGYSPDGKGSWVHLDYRRTGSDWDHVVTHDDPRVVADAIHAHFSATKKSG